MRPDVIPQLADAEQVLRAIERVPDVAYTVLIPNERGLERGLALMEQEGRRLFDEVNLFLSASETHNRKNVNRSIEESLAGLERVVARARAEGLRCEGVISVSFGCPYEGEVPEERVFGIAGRLAEAGCEEIAFGDTTGMANPIQVRGFFEHARERLPGVELTAHFHNTRGQGLANVLAALEAGVDSFESSFGELGGCPVPRGATGNIATEDLVSMLHEMGVETGIDLERLLGCAAGRRRCSAGPLSGHLLTAGPVDWHRFLSVSRFLMPRGRSWRSSPRRRIPAPAPDARARRRAGGVPRGAAAAHRPPGARGARTPPAARAGGRAALRDPPSRFALTKSDYTRYRTTPIDHRLCASASSTGRGSSSTWPSRRMGRFATGFPTHEKYASAARSARIRSSCWC